MAQKFISKIVNGISNKITGLFANPYAQYGLSWRRYIKLKHQDYNQAGEITLNGILIKYTHPPELLHSLEEIFVNDIYKIKLNNISPLMYDCGANIGLSVIRLKIQYPEAKIIAFEPDESNFQLLKQNTKNLSKVEIINKAVWIKDTTLNFEKSGTLSSSISESSSGKESYSVEAIRLKNILNKKIDFLKIDIEGAEFDVLVDCIDVLQNVENLFVEYHGTFNQNNQLNKMLGILTEAGFYYYIKEADEVYLHPFYIENRHRYDLQLNIFACRNI